jgi:hypothetical protein
MKKLLVVLSTLSLLVTFTFSLSHHDLHNKAIDEQKPPAVTTTTTN